MFSNLPRRERVLVKTSLVSAWALSGAAGISAIVLASQAYVEELGPIITIVVGAALFLASLFAAVGVATNRYRWEWISAWLSGLALSPYLGSVWAVVVFAGDEAQVPQGFLVASLVTFYVHRAVMCASHASKLRREHALAEATIEQIEGESNSA